MKYLPRALPEARWLTMKDWKSYWLDTIWDESNRVAKPGKKAKVVQLEGNTVMLDMAFLPFNSLHIPIEIFVMENEDHPILEVLKSMPNVPRAVKCIYRKENRLKYIRSTDYWTFHSDMTKAEESWEKYLKSGIDLDKYFS